MSLTPDHFSDDSTKGEAELFGLTAFFLGISYAGITVWAATKLRRISTFIASWTTQRYLRLLLCSHQTVVHINTFRNEKYKLGYHQHTQARDTHAFGSPHTTRKYPMLTSPSLYFSFFYLFIVIHLCVRTLTWATFSWGYFSEKGAWYKLLNH